MRLNEARRCPATHCLDRYLDQQQAYAGRQRIDLRLRHSWGRWSGEKGQRAVGSRKLSDVLFQLSTGLPSRVDLGAECVATVSPVQGIPP